MPALASAWMDGRSAIFSSSVPYLALFDNDKKLTLGRAQAFRLNSLNNMVEARHFLWC
jgi:hypothetical protein